MDDNPLPNEPMHDIDEAAVLLQLSPAYVRMQVRSGIIRTVRVPVSPGSRVMKHMISASELDLFSQRENARAPRRNDGRQKCFFYATADEVKKIKELLYTSNDPGLAVVAQTVSHLGRSEPDERWIPPSKQ